MGSMGIGHWMVVLVIFLLLFGAGRLSEVGKGLGEGIKNFKKGLRDDEDPPKPVTATSKAVVDVKVDDSAGLTPAPQLVAKRKKVIQVEVDEDDDEAAILAQIAKKKAEGEKTA